MLLLKTPTPEPSDVLLLETVGLAETLQQIPLETTGDPPSLVIFPPPVAEVAVTEVIAEVVSIG
jgi:hypothetical protein